MQSQSHWIAARNEPLVTVFIPVHNRAQYIGQAIQSILDQTMGDFELLIVNDASTDNSREVVQSFNDPRIRLLNNPKNLGRPGTRNKGVAEARGKYIAFLDDDDIAHRERLERQVDYLDSNPDIAVVGSFYRNINERGKNTKSLRVPTAHEDVRAGLIFICPLLQPTLMCRGELARNYPYRGQFRVCEDYDWYIRVVDKHKFANVAQFLTYYRRHKGQSISAEKKHMRDYRIVLYGDILKRIGIRANANDIERHALLQQGNKHFANHDWINLDADYLAWARVWLQRIQAAFASSDSQMQQAVARACASVWCRLCSNAFLTMGPRALRYFFASPLWKIALLDERARTFKARLGHN